VTLLPSLFAVMLSLCHHFFAVMLFAVTFLRVTIFSVTLLEVMPFSVNL
jgi:hypothetical protein